MAHLFEKKDRHVLPNWRSFENTANLGELNGSRGIELTSTFKPDISDILEDWSEIENHTIGVAGDILGVALVSNQESDPKVIAVANFVLQNEKIAPKALLQTAKRILNPSVNKEINLDFESVELFQDPIGLFAIHKKINDLKKRLIKNPANAINWIEIGRLYAILGEQAKAERSVKNALFLSPENRFVLRNMSRFFVHKGEEGVAFAHDIIKKSQLVKHDPWLLSTEISLATLRGRTSRFIKNGLHIVESNSFHPFNITELASSLATIEMKNDNIKKSRKLFKQSLQNPNDNSLAQAEWASQEQNDLFEIDSSKSSLANSFEAKARDFFEKANWVKAIEFSKKWFLDLPFSKGSILFGNNIALKKLRDNEIAVEIGKLGLLSHPHDSHLLNNIIYSLCILDRLDEAQKLFQKVDKAEFSSKSIHNVCLLATSGLFYYKRKDPATARRLYSDAINLAKEMKYNSLINTALVNMAREEILLGELGVLTPIEKLIEISKRSDDLDLIEDIRLVIDLYYKNTL